MLDYLQVAFISTLAELSSGNSITLELVLAKAEEAKLLLQSDNAVSAIAARDVPDGLRSQYVSNVGTVHDRGIQLFQALLTT